jgi:hypothetical protein
MGVSLICHMVKKNYFLNLPIGDGHLTAKLNFLKKLICEEMRSFNGQCPKSQLIATDLAKGVGFRISKCLGFCKFK